MSFLSGCSSLIVLLQCLLVFSKEVENLGKPTFTSNFDDFNNAPFHPMFKFGDFSEIEKSIQNDLRRMSKIMDGNIAEDFPLKKLTPPFELEKTTLKPESTSDIELGVEGPQNDTKIEVKKPLFPNEPVITIEKLFKTLEDLTQPSEVSQSDDFEDTPFIIIKQVDVDPFLGGKFESDVSELFPNKIGIIPEDEMKFGEDSSKIFGFVDEMFDRMSKVMTKIQDTIQNSNMTTTEIIPKLNIEIEDHGFVYNIPPTAYIDTSIPGLVNITWNSDLSSGFNNSLCLKVTKDDNDQIIFHHVHLKIQRENKTHEYKSEKPIFLDTNDAPNAKIKVTEGVQVNFPNSESLNVIIERSKETYPTHWVLFMLALLGLIVALFIMLLSYIVINTKNRQYYAEKENFSKAVPIA